MFSEFSTSAWNSFQIGPYWHCLWVSIMLLLQSLSKIIEWLKIYEFIDHKLCSFTRTFKLIHYAPCQRSRPVKEVNCSRIKNKVSVLYSLTWADGRKYIARSILLGINNSFLSQRIPLLSRSSCQTVSSHMQRVCCFVLSIFLEVRSWLTVVEKCRL
jgi:hypothetical protein